MQAPWIRSMLLAATLTVVGTVPASAADLSPAAVECNRAQLEALAARLTVETPAPAEVAPAQSVFVTYSNRYGFYEGLLVGMPWTQAAPTSVAPIPPAPETHLAFHLNPSVRELLLNPARPPLDQVSLTRERSTSTLVAADDPRAAILRLDPTLGGGGGDADLVVDNLGSAADTKPGRGLSESGLTRLCHSGFSELDRRLFAILQRVLRVELIDLSRGLRLETRITLYRDPDEGRYLAGVYVVDPETGAMGTTPITARIEALPDEGGVLGPGSIEILGDPGAALPGDEIRGTLLLVEPTFPGRDAGYREHASFAIVPTPAGAPGVPLFQGFDWGEMLAGTRWNDGSAVGAEFGRAGRCR